MEYIIQKRIDWIEMADYKRMVSYLYKYKNGVKGENVGYVRVEKMDDQVKFVVRLRDRQAPEGIRMQVCMYYKDPERGLMGFPCGCMELVNGEGEFKGQTGSDNICGGGHRLEEMSGMVVFYNQGMAYGTQWDGIPLKMDQFSCIKDGEEDQDQCQRPAPVNEMPVMPGVGPGNEHLDTSETGQENENLAMPGVGPGNESLNTSETGQEQGNRMVSEAGQTNMDRNHPYNQAAQEKQEEYINDLLDTLGQKPDEGWTDNRNGGLRPGDVQNQTGNQTGNQTRDQEQRELEEAERGPNTQPLWGNQPQKDRMRFQQVDQAIRNNPRLPNMEGSIIGIPGVYSRENEYLAALFGFKEFLPLRGMPVRSGAYGYWIRPLQA